MQSKVALIVLVGFSILGCNQSIEQEEDSKLEWETEQEIHKVNLNDVEIIVLDQCEYIVYKESRNANLGFGYMAHKGNCKNPVHCYKSEIIEKDTIIQKKNIKQ